MPENVQHCCIEETHEHEGNAVQANSASSSGQQASTDKMAYASADCHADGEWNVPNNHGSRCLCRVVCQPNLFRNDSGREIVLDPLSQRTHQNRLSSKMLCADI